MIPLGVLLYQLVKRMRIVFGNPELRILALFTGVIILLGAMFYHKIEGWNWLDALYFAVITLTTIGYGDFVPKTPVGKIFTMMYVIIGLGVLAMFISSVSEQTLAEHRERRAAKDAAAGASQRDDDRDAG
ncbi:MAG: two pore domain potassium channel family protein [Anaerolineales bacterium]|nr:two pore domain potassium channel family protein [Anaerolineales bacterium]